MCSIILNQKERKRKSGTMDVNRIILKHYRVFFIHVYQISVQISNTIGVLSNFRRLVINEHELIIQDKAEGHYPQLVINPHEMSGIEIVITILMKKKEKKRHDIFLMKLSQFLKNSCFFHHPIKLLE